MENLSPAHVVTFSSYWYMRGEPQTAVSDVRDRQSVNLADGVTALVGTVISPGRSLRRCRFPIAGRSVGAPLRGNGL